MHWANLSVQAAKIEFALLMFVQERWSGGQARQFLGYTLHAWQNLLSTRSIESHSGLAGYREDVQTIKRLKQSGWFE